MKTKQMFVCLVAAFLMVCAFNVSAMGEGEESSSGVSGQNLTIYTTLEESIAVPVFQAFEELTGINVEFTRLSTGETVARLEAERENPQVCIWVGGVGLGHIDAKNKGLTMPYVSPNADVIPVNFKDPDNYWTGIYAGMLCFESNIELLERYGLTAPTSWEEICDPKYIDHIQMANPGASGTAYNVLATLVNLFGEDEAFELLGRLDSNIPMYTTSGSKPGKNASIGEITIGIGYSHDAVRLIAEGYPLQLTFPDEGTGYEVASVSLVKGGPEEQYEAAKMLFDFMLTKECAQILADNMVVPFVEGIQLPDGALPISEVNTINQDMEWDAANKARLVELWNEIIGGESKTE
jgi:iron(III) transport system substrate-binding protein